MEFYQNPEFNGTNYDGRGKPKFSELPTEILYEILGKLDPVHRLITRHVSKRFRSLIDAQKLKVKKLGFYELQDGLKIVIDEANEILLSPQTQGGCTVTPNDSDGIFIEGACHVALALNFMKSILSNFSRRNPMYSLLFGHSHSLKVFNYCIDYLASNFSKIHTGLFAIQTAAAATQQPIRLEPLLSLVCPGCLKVLKMEDSQRESVMSLMESEHFRQTLMVNFDSCEPLDSTVVHRFFHLPCFIIHLQRISIDMILLLKNELAKQLNFKSCRIRLVENLDMNVLASVLEEEIHDGSHILHRSPAASSNNYLLFTISKDGVRVKREDDN